jgi:hypothetical protein
MTDAHHKPLVDRSNQPDPVASSEEIHQDHKILMIWSASTGSSVVQSPQSLKCAQKRGECANKHANKLLRLYITVRKMLITF